MSDSEHTKPGSSSSGSGILQSARLVLGTRSRRISNMMRRPLSLVRRSTPNAAAESSSCGSDVDVDDQDHDHDHEINNTAGDNTTDTATKHHVSPLVTAPATVMSIVYSTTVAAPSSRPVAFVTSHENDNSDSAISSSTTTTTTPVVTTSKLLSLPQELFDEITKHLSPAGIVVLALVNKELFNMFFRSVALSQPQLVPGPTKSAYAVLGNYIKDADRTRSRFRGILLSTLDMDHINLVYCYKCRKMHDPFVPFMDRIYAPKKSAKCVDYDDDNHIPPRATRKMLRAITKYRLRGANYRPLLQQVNNTSTSCKNGNVVQISLIMRYRQDNMLLRRQQIISSVDKSPQNLYLFRTQLLLASHPETAPLRAAPKLRRPCNHVAWLDKYHSLLDDLLNPLCLHRSTSNDRHDDHKAPCFTHQTLDLSTQSHNIISERLALPRSTTNHISPLGQVVGCERCTTDMHLDIVPLPAPYHWGFALTTWIDVGKIDLSKKWDSHRPDAGQHRDYPRDEPIGAICTQFEGLECASQFEPTISELNQERLTNFGWMNEAVRRGPGSQLLNWSLEHTVDPATGKIVNPDPLTKADY